MAPRQRRPALAALAVVLILGGAAASAVLVLRSGHKQAVVVVARDLAAGHRIERADLAQAQVSPGNVPVIAWNRAPGLLGRTVAGDLKAGTVLNPAAVTDNPLPQAGQVVVGLALKPGQLPAEGLHPNDHVRALFAPTSTSSNANTLAGQVGTDGVVVDDAIVFARTQVRSDGTVGVSLVVGAPSAALLTRTAAVQAVSLVMLHAGG